MITIRPVLPEELDFLVTFGKETFRDTFTNGNSIENLNNYLDKTFTLEKFKNEYRNKNSFFYFLLFQEKVAGYLKINIENAQTENFGSHHLEIERIYIKQTFQKQKLGSELIKFAIEKAKKLDKNNVWLGVWENNLDAISFYEVFEFKKINTHTFFFGNEEQTDILMRLKL